MFKKFYYDRLGSNFWKSALINLFFYLMLTGAGFFIGKRYYYSHSAPAPTASWFKTYDTYDSARNQLFDSLPPMMDSNAIVLVGTSITEGFPIAEMLFTYRIFNRGIGWNLTSHILKRIGKIAAVHPKMIVLEAGINDIINGLPMRGILQRYGLIIDSIHILSPATKVLVFAPGSVFLKYASFQPSVDSLIHGLTDISLHKDIRFIAMNLGHDPTYSYDGIHLTAKAYIEWRNDIFGMIDGLYHAL